MSGLATRCDVCRQRRLGTIGNVVETCPQAVRSGQSGDDTLQWPAITARRTVDARCNAAQPPPRNNGIPSTALQAASGMSWSRRVVQSAAWD